jgi:hypothetical protein
MLLLYFRLSGWTIVLIFGGVIFIAGLIGLYIYCKWKRTEESRDTYTEEAPVEPNVYRE